MTAVSSIPKFFKSVQLDDKKACLANQLKRQREIPPSFVAGLPLRPYCTNSLKHGLVIRPREQAVRKPYLEINPPSLVSWLVFDIDRDNAAFAWQDVFGLKAPHLAIINQDTGHAHLWYKLASPVCRSNAGRIKPLEYLAAIQRTYTSLLGADPGYAGLVTKNPLHPAHGLLIFRPLSKPYSLSELASNVDLLPKPRKSEVVQGLGRNCTVFDTVRKWAYKAISGYWSPDGISHWKKALRSECKAINQTFPKPLPESEIRAISDSIASWTWKRMTPQGRQALIARTHTPEAQAERGRKSGQARKQARAEDRAKARLMKESGKTVREIAETLGVHYSTVSRWCE
jgi:hypothetical protein